MDWQKVTNNGIVRFIKSKQTHRVFPYFWFISTQAIGMLYSPTIAAIGIFTSIYLVLLMLVPENNIYKKALHFAITIICFLVALLLWNRLIAILPSNDPYRQPLRTATATVNMRFKINNDNNYVDGEHIEKSCATLVLLYNDHPLLVMNASDCLYFTTGNNECYYQATAFNLVGEIGKPISGIVEANNLHIIIGELPFNSNIIDGNVTLVFNNSLTIKIPIPSQISSTAKGAPLAYIVVSDIGRYLKKGK